MKYLYGSFLLIWALVEATLKIDNGYMGTICILIALCLFIIKEKFCDKMWSSSLFGLILIGLAYLYQPVLILMGIVILDFLYHRKYWISVITLLLMTIGLCYMGFLLELFALFAGALFGYIIGSGSQKETQMISALDRERNLRYQLEKIHQDLLNLKNDIEYITEVKERNRIAQEIHDSIGHGIAGVLLQLRAAERTIRMDTDKTEAILKTCTKNLADALEMTRKTVYNIKSDQTTGIDYIRRIIEDFHFCPVDFQHKGDFYALSPSSLKALEATCKEVLTNAMKYSQASHIQMLIEIKSNLVRFYYKDDGVGCDKLVEGSGLNNIRDRVHNLGGTYAVNGSDGFMVVCTFPLTERRANT